MVAPSVRGTTDLTAFLKASYDSEANGLSVTLLSTFYRESARVPPVLVHFSDTTGQSAEQTETAIRLHSKAGCISQYDPP